MTPTEGSLVGVFGVSRRSFGSTPSTPVISTVFIVEPQL